MQGVWQDSSTPHEQKRAKMQQIRMERREQVKTVLNADQEKKLSEMQAQMKQQMSGRHRQANK